MAISFGSDGFRGVIGQGFTKENLARIALAIVRHLRNGLDLQSASIIPFGYDTRFLAPEAAAFMAGIFRRFGINARLSDIPCPSPYLAFACHAHSAPLGVQVSASHNPPLYGGVKLKGGFGGSLMPDAVARIESFAMEQDEAELAQILREHDLYGDYAHLPRFNFGDIYRGEILMAADWDTDFRPRVYVDYMHGASSGIYGPVLRELLDLRSELRIGPDPFFGGHKPEPMPENLRELRGHVSMARDGSIGLAFDGDGDRLGVVDENGECLATHEIYAILLEHVVESGLASPCRAGGMDDMDMPGIVVASVSFSGLVGRVAAAHDLILHEVPVGFKHVTQAMLHMGALMGGEESGGTGFGHYLPERDALLMALLLLSAMRRRGQRLCDMVSDLYARYGRPWFLHYDIALPPGVTGPEFKPRVRELADLQELAGETVIGFNHRDGMKLRTAGGWVLVRTSGTEPLLRIYSEGDTPELALKQAHAVADFVGLQLPAH
ncbi:hypothetical protein IT575_15660 [bacterium]|nr:hypothetical protein [bacterium]